MAACQKAKSAEGELDDATASWYPSRENPGDNNPIVKAPWFPVSDLLGFHVKMSAARRKILNLPIARLIEKVHAESVNKVGNSLTFEFEPEPNGYSPLYLTNPSHNPASINAGDCRLYVGGGGAINAAFLRPLKKEQGRNCGKW